MSCLRYRNNHLYIEDVSLKEIADQFGTPCYIYSRAALEKNWHAFDDAFSQMPHKICYAVKANSNLAILSLLAKLNSGFDIVSLGELERVLAAGGDAKKIIFSGVGKKEIEIEKAIEKGIYCFNVESEPELDRLQIIAANLGKTVNIAMRINPNIDPRTHSHISTGLKENKFGIELDQVIPLYQHISSMKELRLIGLACHIGSQLVELEPFLLAVDSLLLMYQQLKKRGAEITHIDVGGGLGIVYRDENPPGILEYAKAIEAKFAPFSLEIIIEPGRAIVGNAGALLTRIEYVKHTSQVNFAIVDAGMNDLVRPALYDAWQDILPVEVTEGEKKIYDIAGPVCESADFLGKNRPLAISAGDLLAVDSAGAYGFSMSSNYNSRPRSAEVLVDGKKAHLIRSRETIAALFATEKAFIP